MKFIRTLHKWLGLIAGVQLAIWLASGLMMSALDNASVSGDITAAEEREPAVLPDQAQLVEPATLLSDSAEPVFNVELRTLLGRWVWRVQTASSTLLLDARSGEPLHIDAAHAQQIAVEGYAGPAAGSPAVLLNEPTIEARDQAAPLWRIDFNDEQRTRYYVAGDGEIVARRTDTWRVFDFFWMLHTMDYRGRDDFNHPLVIIVAFLSVWLALSGALLLPQAFKRRR